MRKVKINLDRVGISSEDITKRMNFEDILVHQKIMAKPFYKSTWFFGVTGLATVSLIAGSMYAVKPEGDNLIKENVLTDNLLLKKDAVPIIEVVKSESKKEELDKNKPTKKEIEPIEKTSTLSTITNQKPYTEIEVSESIIDDKVTEVVAVEKPKTFSYIDLYPRISGKLNGNITKEQLLNDEGLVTNSDVKIVSFQLHLVDGTGGKVYEGNGNTLNSEMKSAIGEINVGEEIYFEKIDGKATTGEIVRLLPLRYVLLN